MQYPILGLIISGNRLLWEVILFKVLYIKYGVWGYPQAAGRQNTNILDLDHIRRIPESPLQVFGIEVDRLFELFEKLSSGLQKKITVSRTAGIKTLNFGSTKEEEILKDVYGNNEEGRFLL